MSLGRLVRGGRFLARRAGEVGVREAVREAMLKAALRPQDVLPFARINKAGLLEADVESVHAQERDAIRTTSLVHDASKVEDSYPEVMEADGRFLRYAYLPARQASQGLVVLFHGHNAFLHLGPVRAWEHFDVLAPWDTFGFHRQGSWFWGEKGNGFVAAMVARLVAEIREKRSAGPLFTMGASMGGFGALWHGMSLDAAAMYVMCPQVDLAAKIVDSGGDGPYAHLAGDAGGPPDLLALAQSRPDLPPLYLIQNLYDHVNPFAGHARRLLDVYDAKRGWYGLRVHPSVGHGGDGKQEEAEMFFRQVLERQPPRRFPG
jgi:hypothetical protein